MNPKRRELMHRAMNHELKLVPVMHQLARYKHCDKILLWLISANIIGKDLLEFLQLEFNNSVMAMVQFIVMRNEKNKEIKSMIIGRDWA